MATKLERTHIPALENDVQLQTYRIPAGEKDRKSETHRYISE